MVDNAPWRELPSLPELLKKSLLSGMTAATVLLDLINIYILLSPLHDVKHRNLAKDILVRLAVL